MTIRERRNPDILNANRRKRIAKGSGHQVQDVNRVIKEFYNMQLLMKKFGKLDKKGLNQSFSLDRLWFRKLCVSLRSSQFLMTRHHNIRIFRRK